MSVHLITGYAGKEHITSADHGSFNAAVMGGGEFVLEGGEQFRCQVISNNKVRIFDGEALMQGRHIKVERNTYEETTHDNGTQGYKRIDLIVLTYTKNATTGIEDVSLDVIKGTPAESNPVVPGYVTGDILNLGELTNQMPLYQVPFDGLSIGEPVALFQTVETAETMKKKVKEELEAKFDALSEELSGQIADAGKPLSSDADEWTMIENYGEYSADAKTVGEEFAKVNDSLVADNSQKFQFAYDSESEKYGYMVTDSEGADTFCPFKDGLNYSVVGGSGYSVTVPQACEECLIFISVITTAKAANTVSVSANDSTVNLTLLKRWSGNNGQYMNAVVYKATNVPSGVTFTAKTSSGDFQCGSLCVVY